MRSSLMQALVLGVMGVLAVASCQAEDGPNGEATDDSAGGRAVALSLDESRGEVVVTAGGRPFASYIYKGLPAPAIYPVVGPGGVMMTRHYPFREDVPGEASDHPHHRSLWYAHGSVNGVDFWHGGGRVVTQGEPTLEGNTIRTVNHWVDKEGKVICSEERAIRFGVADGARTIDFVMTFRADHGEVTFGDTKEGSMAIRTHPNLRLTNAPDRGVTTANGKAVNSEGDKDKGLWGKRAKWVDYWGEVGGRTVGVAIFDHPENPRHPTWWHARDYGLIAANPFGVHDFERKPGGTGDLTIRADQRVTFRYRFVFHAGDVAGAKVADRYEAWAGEQAGR